MIGRAIVMCLGFALTSALQVAAQDSAPRKIHVEPNTVALAGRDAWRQLIVTGEDAVGKVRDLTRDVSYDVEPAGIVRIDSTGLVTPIKDGKTTITIAGVKVPVSVTHVADDMPINFSNEVVPLFTKFGCNAGACHGKASGQNGFKLSLLGFEPDEDYEYIVKEARGRRIMASAPANSMLLLKASGGMAHGGGKRIDADSPAYRVLLRWVEQGAPWGRVGDPTVTRIEVLPRERLLERNSSQQLCVIAYQSDGTTVDVTRMAQFEVNDRELADVNSTGLVTTRDVPGTFAVMARYQTHVSAFRALVPLGAKPRDSRPWAFPKANNFIDEHVIAQWRKLGLPPSELCDDATFIRRVTLDIAGRLPTLEVTQAFLADKAADRHEKLVDRLLASPDYADYFAGKWSAVLRNRRANSKDDARPTFAFHAWIRESLDKNVPFDEFVRGVLTAKGEAIKEPPVAWYREVKDVSSQVEDAAQLFLGQRIACAKCHHHPLEKWSTNDYWALAAFFTRVDVKAPKLDKKDKKNEPAVSWIVSLKPGRAEAQNPRTKEFIKAAGLDAPDAALTPDDDPRGKLVDWMADPKNPYFARTLVNRYWKHFLGRGLVEPEDDLRATNPPSNPELLDALAKQFVDSKYDLKKLVRAICTSNTYRLSAIPNVHNADDRQNYSRFLPRRLPAEVLYDAIDAVTLSKPAFKGVPAGTRAVQLPDNQFESYFLSVFGRPDFATACECERGADSSLAQTLHMYNSIELAKKVAGERLKQLANDKRPADDRLRDLYMIALSRPPSAAELATLKAYLEARPNNQSAAYEDLLWALMNTKEFLYNH
jgi:hypothetical protein